MLYSRNSCVAFTWKRTLRYLKRARFLILKREPFLQRSPTDLRDWVTDFYFKQQIIQGTPAGDLFANVQKVGSYRYTLR